MTSVIDAQLAQSGGYIAGAAFTVADIAIGLSIHRWHSVPLERQALVHVSDYYDRLCQRAGFVLYGRDGGP